MPRRACKARYEAWSATKVPASISCVHARNAALVHLLAAERVSEPAVGGHAFFARDYEANVVEMALESFDGTSVKPLLLPLALAYCLAYLLDVVDRLLHALARMTARDVMRHSWLGATVRGPLIQHAPVDAAAACCETHCAIIGCVSGQGLEAQASIARLRLLAVRRAIVWGGQHG